MIFNGEGIIILSPFYNPVMGALILKTVVVLLMSICFYSCTRKVNKEVLWINELIATDKEFSNVSANKGMPKAFIDYIDDDGILLRPNHLPIVGANAIEFLTQINDTSFTLTWAPTAAEVSSSGDLGYSYGIYKLQLQDTMLQGTYVNIWKKDKDGKWKFILDSGNQGINNVVD
jgi:ketosteroid isomerase-like protein